MLTLRSRRHCFIATAKTAFPLRGALQHLHADVSMQLGGHGEPCSEGRREEAMPWGAPHLSRSAIVRGGWSAVSSSICSTAQMNSQCCTVKCIAYSLHCGKGIMEEGRSRHVHPWVVGLRGTPGLSSEGAQWQATMALSGRVRSTMEQSHASAE